mgnify:CR=1 FL=1
MLLQQGQEHLFRDWPALGVDDEKKISFFDQVSEIYLFILYSL